MPFDPATDISDVRDKVILITGGTAGLGKQSILILAQKNPAHIYFTGRDSDRAATLITQVTTLVPSAQLTFLKCNMSSLASVAAVAMQLAANTLRLDILMCNAGVFDVPPALTEDGYEVMFGINHMAHALLIKLLLPTLLLTLDARIVILASEAFRSAPGCGIDFAQLHTPQASLPARLRRYPQSKLANVLYTAELARRHPQLMVVAVHPGVVGTDMLLNAGILMRAAIRAQQWWAGAPIVTPEEGAWTQLWAATVKGSALVSGEYYIPVGLRGEHTALSADEELARKLWDWTEKELKNFTNQNNEP
ncbi:oxidoreductase [Mycena crocata]|nr:oxidoreductase [Mycena crocata]